MKTTDQEENDFEYEMKDDPIVNLYKGISLNQPESKPSSELLASYRNLTQAKTKPLSNLKLRIQQFFEMIKPVSITWNVPVFLVTGIVLGVMIAPLLHMELDRYSDPGQGIPGFRNGHVPASGSGKEFKSYATPEEWLEDIATLVYEGNIEQAENELKAFKNKYPDFRKQGDQ